MSGRIELNYIIIIVVHFSLFSSLDHPRSLTESSRSTFLMVRSLIIALVANYCSTSSKIHSEDCFYFLRSVICVLKPDLPRIRVLQSSTMLVLELMGPLQLSAKQFFYTEGRSVVSSASKELVCCWFTLIGTGYFRGRYLIYIIQVL